METLLQDIRYGFRMLIKNPRFSLVAVTALALGIGANTAIFSVVNGVLLRPLPFADPDRLMMVWINGPEATGGDRTPLSVADLLDWRAQNQAFESIGAFGRTFYNYTEVEGAERVRAASVTGNFFDTLGAKAALGRTFLPDEERPGANRVVVISQGFWRQRLAADAHVLGASITLNDTSFTIVGVMPDEFDFPQREFELWTAMQIEPPNRRGPYFLRGVARLKPGVTHAQARADLDLIASRIYGDKAKATGNFNVLPVSEFIVGDVRPALLALLGAVALVLLIATANIANLMLARAAARKREISIRIALGAGRWRVIRQLLTESLLLAVLGGTLGLLFAVWGVDLLLSLAPDDIRRLQNVGIDARVLGWTLLVSLLSGIIFGLAPALQSSRINLSEALKEGGRSATDEFGKQRLRDVLVVSEIALALMLLIGAGLFVKSFLRLQHVDPIVALRYE